MSHDDQFYGTDACQSLTRRYSTALRGSRRVLIARTQKALLIPMTVLRPSSVGTMTSDRT
jgi:hypothetical protein